MVNLCVLTSISAQLCHDKLVVLGNYQIIILISYTSVITNKVTSSDCSQSGFISYS